MPPTMNLCAYVPKEAAVLDSEKPFAIQCTPPPSPPSALLAPSRLLLLPTAHHVPDKNSADSTSTAVN